MTPTTEELAKELEEGARAIDTDGTPSQIGPDTATLRAAAARLRELERDLREVGELIIDLSDGLEDEGDRVFLKSTNDGDRLRQASFAVQARRYAHRAQLTEPRHEP